MNNRKLMFIAAASGLVSQQSAMWTGIFCWSNINDQYPPFVNVILGIAGFAFSLLSGWFTWWTVDTVCELRENEKG